MQADKATLRAHYKTERTRLSTEERAEKSMAISNGCLGLPLWEYSCFHLFLSSVLHNEIDTQPLLSILFGKDKRVVVPKMKAAAQLEHYLLEETTPLKLNPYNIPEPQSGQLISPQEIDVVFVPLLAFDKTGQRVGYGKGYYDRFLMDCRSDVIKVGLSFFEAVERITDTTIEDIPLDVVVCPQKHYKF